MGLIAAEVKACGRVKLVWILCAVGDMAKAMKGRMVVLL